MVLFVHLKVLLLFVPYLIMPKFDDAERATRAPLTIKRPAPMSVTLKSAVSIVLPAASSAKAFPEDDAPPENDGASLSSISTITASV